MPGVGELDISKSAKLLSLFTISFKPKSYKRYMLSPGFDSLPGVISAVFAVPQPN